jgi:hypothetical protein
MKSIMKHYQKGAVVLLYVVLMVIIAILFLAITQSQLLLARRRSVSATDSIITAYQAESEINDFFARLTGGYIDSGDLPIIINKNIGGTEIEIEATGDADNQTVTVTAKRAFAVSKIQGSRGIEVGTVSGNIDVILGLDCTGSMNGSADGVVSPPTRFDAQEAAVVNFIDRLIELDQRDNFHLGVLVFGGDAKWLQHGGVDVTPDSGLSYEQIKLAVENGFNTYRHQSPACTPVISTTSVGSAYLKEHEYFAGHKEEDRVQIEVVITDGYPNSRIPYDSCPPSVYCPAYPHGTCDSNEYGWVCFGSSEVECNALGVDFLRCTLADSDTWVTELSQYGTRDPEVDAYGVTIFASPPSDVVDIFNTYASEGGYFNANQANELTDILDTIFEDIVEKYSGITFQRLIPLP